MATTHNQAMTTPTPQILSDEELALVDERLKNGVYEKLSPATALRLLATIEHYREQLADAIIASGLVSTGEVPEGVEERAADKPALRKYTYEEMMELNHQKGIDIIDD